MFSHTSLNFPLFFFIFLVSIQSILTLNCYECLNCTKISSCTCKETIEVNITNAYCILEREAVANSSVIRIKHIPRNLTTYYVYDPYYISVVETIFYDNTTQQWLTKSNKIAYGCQTDNCNRDDLLEKLPSNGLGLMLPIDWLNDKLQRKQIGDPTLCRTCDVEKLCVDSSESSILKHRCPRNECNGTCYVEEIFDTAETSDICYTSFCLDDTIADPQNKLSEIVIIGIYYINKKVFEILQIAMICNGDDCSDVNIYQDVKNLLQMNINNINPFLPMNHVNSIYSTSICFLIMILLFQILISY